jgi:feruloyl esterase
MNLALTNGAPGGCRRLARAGLLAALAIPAIASAVESSDPCAALAALDYADAVGATVTVRVAEQVPATRKEPAFCRVAGTIAPQVGFEVRLPGQQWNQRLLVTGCTNLCGSIETAGMQDGVRRGYATATTDLGHQSASATNASWALNATGLEDDFGHRATHVTTALARDIVAAYYGSGPGYAYFAGCSTGGRQGLVAASRYPDDFDGAIAGAPFQQLLSVPQMAWALASNAGVGGAPILGRRELALLGKAALANCDAGDGLADGVIGDPEHCGFDPLALRCAPGQVAECLTDQQARAAARIYAGPDDGRGRLLTPGGVPVGSEPHWSALLLPGRTQPGSYAYVVQNWQQYLAFEPDPVFATGPLEFDFAAWPGNLAASHARVGFSANLDRFRARGGRLILYHGWSDAVLVPAHTLGYWRQLAAHSGSASVDEFARLYMVPGMLHCHGGPGASVIDYLAALEEWVEQGTAPDRLLALHEDRGAGPGKMPRDANAKGFSRPLFPYPGVAIYDGKGDPHNADSFSRALPGAAQPPPAGR